MTRARRKQPPLAGAREPLVLLRKDGNIRRVAALDGPAIAHGLFTGQPLADALAVCPALTAAEAEPEADEQALHSLAIWAQRYSPSTAAALPDGIWLDITGCAHLWGGEEGLAEDLLGRLERLGIAARAAIAQTYGAAWALAHHTNRILVAQDGAHGDLLAPLPVERLRLSLETASTLRKLGLATIGHVQKLPRNGLARRFPDLLPRLDQAMGLIDEAIAFLQPPTPWIERIRFPDPIATPDDLQRALAELLRRLCARLEETRHGALHWQAQFFRADGGMQTVHISTALPARDPGRLMRLFREKVETVDPGFGVDVVAIEAEGAEPLDSRQVSLLRPVKERGNLEELAALIESFENRLGKDRVFRMAFRETYAPERTVKRDAVFRPKGRQNKASGPHSKAVRTKKAPEEWEDFPATQADHIELPGERPIRLFLQPEIIEVTAMLPDAPPLLFRWRRLVHRVRRAEGPERISAEWWRMGSGGEAGQPHDETAQIRDYYRVETQSGLRVWLYRQGSYSAGPLPRWYLHGLFG